MQVDGLFKWLLGLPQMIANFGSWLNTPIYPPYIVLSPLELLGVAGVSTIIVIIGMHVVRLFVG